MNYDGKKGLAKAFATLFDNVDPLYKEVQRMNKKGFMPRYHLEDDDKPRIVDLKK